MLDIPALLSQLMQQITRGRTFRLTSSVGDIQGDIFYFQKITFKIIKTFKKYFFIMTTFQLSLSLSLSYVISWLACSPVYRSWNVIWNETHFSGNILSHSKCLASPISLNTLTLLNYINTLLVNVIIRKQDLCSHVKSSAEKHLFIYFCLNPLFSTSARTRT